MREHRGARDCRGLLEINASLVSRKELQIVLYVLRRTSNPDESLAVLDNSLLPSVNAGCKIPNLIKIRSFCTCLTKYHKSAVLHFCGDLDLREPPGTEIGDQVFGAIAEVRNVETVKLLPTDPNGLCRSVEAGVNEAFDFHQAGNLISPSDFQIFADLPPFAIAFMVTRG